MTPTLLFIRHMVCSKCVLVVREQLLALGLGLVPLRVELGEVEVRGAAESLDWPRLHQCLEAEGFAGAGRRSLPRRLVAPPRPALRKNGRPSPHILVFLCRPLLGRRIVRVPWNQS